MRNQAVKSALDAFDVAPSRSSRSLQRRLPIRTPPASLVRGKINVVNEPRPGADGRSDPERSILTTDECLEVIVDDDLVERREAASAPGMKEDRVPAEALRHPGDGGFRTVLGSRDLPMSRAGGKARRHRDEELGSLQVVGRRKGRSRAGSSAVAARESRNVLRVVLPSIPTVPYEALSFRSMGDAIDTRTERRHEPGRTYGFNGMERPAHTPEQGKRGATLKPRKIDASVSGR
jgi:hypothetical protein